MAKIGCLFVIFFVLLFNGYVCDDSEVRPYWDSLLLFCMKWTATGDGAQCQAGREELCAAEGTYTSDYIDNTDDRTGGCKMQWGIKIFG